MATPPDFTVGQVLTAAQMNAVGLWLVKTQTIGSAVSTVTVTNAFSADYDNYLISVQGGTASTNGAMSMQLGATATGYYGTGLYIQIGGVFASYQDANTAGWASCVYFSTTNLSGRVLINSPFLSKNTTFEATALQSNTSGFFNNARGFLNNTTSYTDFKLTTTAGTVTGGTIRVYGYRN